MSQTKCIAYKSLHIETPVKTFFKIIVGPSSSHTYGPYEIGLSIRDKLEEYPDPVNNLKIIFYNSMALTGEGHMAHVALIAGLLNLELSDLKESHNILEQQQGNLNIPGKDVKFDLKDLILNPDDHPDKDANGIELIINEGSNEKRFDWRSVGGGIIDPPRMKVEFNDLPPQYKFTNWKGFKLQAVHYDGPIMEYILNREELLLDPINPMSHMRQVLDAMRESVAEGLKLTGWLPGDQLMAKSRFKWLEYKKGHTPLFSLAQIYAEAAAESSSAGGKIITAPTAGGGGVLPGVMVALSEKGLIHRKKKSEIRERQLLYALFLAGVIGQVFEKNATIAGARGGCTFEVGVGAAMAAGAASYLHIDDDPDPRLKRTNLNFIETVVMNVFSDWIGIPCDPVGGRVQIPCIRRNGKAAKNVFEYLKIGLSRRDLLYQIRGFDKQIAQAYVLGENLPKEFRETSLGGHAILEFNPKKGKGQQLFSTEKKK